MTGEKYYLLIVVLEFNNLGYSKWTLPKVTHKESLIKVEHQIIDAAVVREDHLELSMFQLFTGAA